jgi:hypothetical protein
MQEALLYALRQHTVVWFTFVSPEEFDGGRRKVEPFTLGRGAFNELLLRGYQTGGHSRSGGLPGWRLFPLSGISGVTLTEESFPARPHYRHPDPAMVNGILAHFQPTL